MDLLWGLSVLCLLCLCGRLFICAFWSPAGKGLTPWLSFVMYNCEKDGKYQESIQSSTTSDPGYHMGK